MATGTTSAPVRSRRDDNKGQGDDLMGPYDTEDDASTCPGDRPRAHRRSGTRRTRRGRKQGRGLSPAASSRRPAGSGSLSRCRTDGVARSRRPRLAVPGRRTAAGSQPGDGAGPVVVLERGDRAARAAGARRRARTRRRAGRRAAGGRRSRCTACEQRAGREERDDVACQHDQLEGLGPQLQSAQVLAHPARLAGRAARRQRPWRRPRRRPRSGSPARVSWVGDAAGAAARVEDAGRGGTRAMRRRRASPWMSMSLRRQLVEALLVCRCGAEPAGDLGPPGAGLALGDRQLVVAHGLRIDPPRGPRGPRRPQRSAAAGECARARAAFRLTG